MPPKSIFADLAAMAWLDVRTITNAFSRINREPVRLFGWLFWVVFFVWKLVLQPHGIGLLSDPDIGAPMDLAASLLLFVASVSLIRGEQPAIAFFATPLEARWMSGSRLRPGVTITYLQMRNIFHRLPSFAIFLAFVLSFCMPPMHSVMPAVLAVANVTLITLCSRIFSLPRELAPQALRVPLIIVGCCLCVCAMISGVEGLSDFVLHRPFFPNHVPVLHPGLAFIYGARGDIGVTLIAGAVLVACMTTLIVFSRDRYPELYEISRAGWEVRSRFREGRMYESGAEDAGAATSAALARIPSGAPVLLWTNWQMYRRQNMRRWPIIRPLLVIAVGIGLASLHIAPQTLGNTVGVVFALATTFSSLIDATRIGIAVRHPIFWLTRTSFTSRLTMIVFGWYWRSASDIVLFGGGAVFAGAPFQATFTAVGFAVVGVWLQRCVGLAAFALLPSKVDLNGPTALARFGLAAILIVPPVFIGVVAAGLLHGQLVGYSIGGLLAIVEAQALIYFSARLLDGRFDKILGG